MNFIYPNFIKIFLYSALTLFSIPLFSQANFYVTYPEDSSPHSKVYTLYKVDYLNCEIEEVIEFDLYEYSEFEGGFPDIAFCPLGNIYIIHRQGNVFFLDTLTGEIDFQFKFENSDGDHFPGLAIDYLGNFYAVGSNSGKVYVYYPEKDLHYQSQSLTNRLYGYDLSFYNGSLVFPIPNHPFPSDLVLTDLLGEHTITTLLTYTDVSFGGLVSYGDSCNTNQIIGFTLHLATSGQEFNQPFYEFFPKKDSLALHCDSIFPNINRGSSGATHRKENLASMPAVELQSSEYLLEYIYDCSPSTARLTVTASGGISEIYFALNDNNFSRDSVFILDEPGWYEIIAKDSRSCFWTDSFYFDPPPDLSFGDIIIGEEACTGAENGTVELEVFGGFPPYVYTLNGGNPQSDGVFGGLTGGDYFIEVIDSMGCRIDTLVQLGISPEPDFELMVEDEYCQSTNGRIEVSGISLTGMEFSLDASDFLDSPVFKDLPAGIYSVWVRDSLDCLYSETAEITRIEDVIFTHFSDTSCSYAVLSLDSLWLTSAAGCDSVVVTQRVPADFTTVVLQDFDCFAQQTYSDSIWIQHSDDCDTLKITTYSPATSDSIFITRDTCSWQPITDEVFLYSNQYGCDSVVTIQYNQFLPSLTEVDSLICHQSSPDTLYLTNHLGCDSLVIIRYHTVDLWLDLGPDLYIQAGEEVMLNPQYNMQIESFAWQPEDFLSAPESLFPIASPEQDIQYRLMVTDIHGCTINDDINIFVSHPDLSFPVYIPNAFSPNDDGINDVFTVYFAEGQHPPYSLKVWDRWGALIYNCSGDNCQWDGTFKGQLMQAGTYLFELRFALNGSEEIRVGEVVLVR